jgi:hypothetical protein
MPAANGCWAHCGGFGTGREDPTWDALFDEIEQRREATRNAD